jgi:Sec-independent protein translocase protein TatA
MPGNIGWTGAVVIILVLLPEMGRSLGRGMREFKDSISGNDHDEPESEQTQLPQPTASAPSTPDAETPPQTQQSERVAP